MIEPYDWQEKAVNRGANILAHGDLLLNTSDTGTGKTVCTLQNIKDLELNALVIAPKSVHTAWKQTAKDMGVTLAGVINPERLQYKNPYYTKKDMWELKGIDAVVVDEIHKGASGPKSTTTRIIGQLKAYPVKVIALSATIADSPLKLRCVGYLAGLHKFNNNSYLRWCLDHACFKMPGVRTLKFNTGPKGTLAIKDIASKLKPVIVRIDSEKTPGFPTSLINVNVYDLEAHDLAEFNKITAEMDMKLKLPGANALVEMLRARQRTELLKIPVLMELIEGALDSDLAPVVFVNFKDTVAELNKRLAEKKVSCGVIWGNQTTAERDVEIAQFQCDNVSVMLATISAGGVGISLHAKTDSKLRNRTSFITPSFSASEMVQALGRIHRAGGHNVVQNIVLAADTIEERIHLALKGKISRIEKINDGDLV